MMNLSTRPEKTVVHCLFGNADQTPEQTGYKLKRNGIWVEVSWKEAANIVLKVAYGLYSLGVKREEKVSIVAQTRFEWIMSDLGIMTLGAITIPIYPTLLPHNIEYIINHSDTVLVFAENKEQVDKLYRIKEKIPNVRKVVVFDWDDSFNDDWLMKWDDLLKMGEEAQKKEPELYKKWLDQISEEDVATIIYTSGTTGLPKGAMIIHRNIMANARDVGKILEHEEKEFTIGYLPVSHAYERINALGAVVHRLVYGIAESLDKVGENLRDIRPSLLPGVPRVYEKLYQRINQMIEESPPLKKKIFNWAKKVGEEMLKYKEKGRNPPLSLRVKYAVANKLVFEKLREAVGGKLKFGITAAAPLSPEIIKFFQSLGIPLYEGYGMTECMAPATMNTPKENKIGTVGKPLPSAQIKIAEDGEILIKGPSVFIGYYKNEEETRKTLDDEGWLHTGDLGELDEDGFLKITGRKKELIITAGGKNISPQEIENTFGQDPYITHIVPYGDQKKFLTAVISPNREELEKWAKEKGIKYSSFEELTKHPEVQKFYKELVDKYNKLLPSYETIKYFILADHEFSIETGEITPTLKVKKNVVISRYRDELEKLYPPE